MPAYRIDGGFMKGGATLKKKHDAVIMQMLQQLCYNMLTCSKYLPSTWRAHDQPPLN